MLIINPLYRLMRLFLYVLYSLHMLIQYLYDVYSLYLYSRSYKYSNYMCRLIVSWVNMGLTYFEEHSQSLFVEFLGLVRFFFSARDTSLGLAGVPFL